MSYNLAYPSPGGNFELLEVMASDYHGQAWHDVQIYAPYCTGKKNPNERHRFVTAKSVRREGLSDFWKWEKYFSVPWNIQLVPLTGSWFFLFTFYRRTSGKRRVWPLGFQGIGQSAGVDQCSSTDVQWWVWLTPVDSLAPYHLSTEGCGICYPFGALVNVCLTLKVHFALLIKFQLQDRHKST